MILWIEHSYNVEDSQEAPMLESKADDDEDEESNNCFSNFNAYSPYNSADTEMVHVLVQATEIHENS